MKKYLFFIICLIFHKNYTERFIYPVADFQNGKQLMVLYQKSLHDIELWIWDTTNHYAIKGLSSFLIPANLRMLPSENGFSFIDQGYIKIKEFSKRSPQTLPIYESISFFSSMNWIDDETFYMVAREGDFYQIFQSDLQATIQRLTYDAADALYPQKINDDLFYIKRNDDNEFYIIRKPWNPIPINSKDFIFTEEEILIKHKNEQICFLRMINNQEGFYIQAPMKKDNTYTVYTFYCYHFEKINGIWITEKLFDFKIPIKYVTGIERIYESIEPFLPNYTSKNHIYFVDWDDTNQESNIYKFDRVKKSFETIYNESHNKYKKMSLFTPYIYQEKIFCGYILNNENQIEKLLQKKIESEIVRFELAVFREK